MDAKPQCAAGIRARRRVPALMVSNRATVPGYHARARAPGMAGGRVAVGVDGLKTGLQDIRKHSRILLDLLAASVSS